MFAIKSDRNLQVILEWILKIAFVYLFLQESSMVRKGLLWVMRDRLFSRYHGKDLFMHHFFNG